MWIRLFAVLAVLIAACGAATAAPVVADAGLRVLANGDEYEREMDASKAAGVQWISLSAGWPALQPSPGAQVGPTGPGGPEWIRLQDRLRYAHSIGLKTFVQLSGAPVWATDGRPQGLEGGVPPRPDALPAYAAFLDAFARGLGADIDAYSPWNEVNQKNYWYPIDPVLYTRLQQAAYPAIKGADPTSIVVSGTIFGKPGSLDFLRRTYAAGIKGSYDVLGWMIFTSAEPEAPAETGTNAQRFLSSVAEVQAVLGQLDPAARIWIVEYSHSTCTPLRVFCWTEAQQADLLTRAFTYMRRNLQVERLFWFSLRDKGTDASIESNYGLMRFDFSAKPSYAALRALAVETPGGGTGGTGGAGPAAPQLPAAAAIPPQKPVFRSGRRLVALGTPRLTLSRGRFTLRMTIRVTGGKSRIVVQGFRTGRWRAVTAFPLKASSKVVLRFRDRGYTGIRIRATRPGGRAFVASRVVRVPR